MRLRPGLLLSLFLGPALFVEAGGLMSYAVNYCNQVRHARFAAAASGSGD